MITLSVVVTVVDGGEALRRCLRVLAAQRDAPAIEVLVPYDETAAGVDALRAEFPGVTFLALGRMETRRPADGGAGRHELYDRRRAAGLAAARGELVAMVEDRGAPRDDWARAAVRLHESLPHAAIGGVVTNAVNRPLNWAVFFCDFGRYQPPLAAGPARHISDINICYKRRALDATREVWRERYHEPAVHGALLARGETLFLSPEMVVEERRERLALGPLLAERFHWGRLFAAERGRELGLARRLAYGALAPALPLVLFARLLRLQLQRRATPGRFLLVAPLTFVLLVAWSTGELAGYVTGTP